MNKLLIAAAIGGVGLYALNSKKSSKLTTLPTAPAAAPAAAPRPVPAPPPTSASTGSNSPVVTTSAPKAKTPVPVVNTPLAPVNNQDDREYYEPLLDSAVVRNETSSATISTSTTKLSSPKGTVAVQVNTPQTKDVIAVTQYDADAELKSLGSPCSRKGKFSLYQNNGLTTVDYAFKNGVYEMTVKKNLFGDYAYVAPITITEKDYIAACSEYKKNGMGIRNSIIKRTWSQPRVSPSNTAAFGTPVTFWSHTKDGLFYDSPSIDANPVTWSGGFLHDGDFRFYNIKNGFKNYV